MPIQEPPVPEFRYSLPRDKLRYWANWMQTDKKARHASACIAWAAKSATWLQQTACRILYAEFYICTWGVQRCPGTGKLKGDLFGLVTWAGQPKKLPISLKFKAPFQSNIHVMHLVSTSAPHSQKDGGVWWRWNQCFLRQHPLKRNDGVWNHANATLNFRLM